MNTVSHNANEEDRRKEPADAASNHYSSKAESRSTVKTQRNETVDVFEYEPNGFMSRGRW